MDAVLFGTDVDGLSHGLGWGLAEPLDDDTDIQTFIADADAGVAFTYRDIADTGGLSARFTDANGKGVVDAGESDLNDATDPATDADTGTGPDTDPALNTTVDTGGPADTDDGGCSTGGLAPLGGVLPLLRFATRRGRKTAVSKRQ
jgi:hypothetical protein